MYEHAPRYDANTWQHGLNLGMLDEHTMKKIAESIGPDLSANTVCFVAAIVEREINARFM